jgi:hypothetical protein
MLLFITFVMAAKTTLSCKNNIPSLEIQKEYVASIIQDYRTHNLNPFEIPDARWFSMAECGFYYTQKAINTIEKNDLKEKQLSSLKKFWELVKITYNNKNISLKDLQIININFVYILSNQPVYIDTLKTVQSNLQNIKNTEVLNLDVLVNSFKSMEFLPLDGSIIPSLYGNIGTSNNITRDKNPIKIIDDAIQSGAFLGFNTNDCYVITFYPPEGSTGLFTEESFLKNFFGDICIYAHYLPNNDPLDLDQTPHAHDLVTFSPYLVYTHDVLHSGYILSFLLPILQKEYIDIDLSNPKNIQKTSIFKILKEDLSKQNNKELIYFIYQLIHEDFVPFFDRKQYDFDIHYNEFEKAINPSNINSSNINPSNNESASLKSTYFNTLPLRTRFYSQLLRFIQEQPSVKSLYERIVEDISYTSFEENSNQYKYISAHNLIHETIFQYYNKKNRNYTNSMPHSTPFTWISGRLIEQDQTICLNLFKLDNSESVGIFPISEKIIIDSTMAFQVTFIPVDLKTVDESYKELFIQINQVIKNFSNKFEEKYTAYAFINSYISEGQALTHLNYEPATPGHKGMHDIEYLIRIKNTWIREITKLLTSSEFNANLTPKSAEEMQDQIDSYKEALNTTKKHLQKTIITNMNQNKNNQEQTNQLFLEKAGEFKNYLTVINKSKNRIIWESLLDKPLVHICNEAITGILTENTQKKEKLDNTAVADWENQFLLIQDFIQTETTPFDTLLQIFFSKDTTYCPSSSPSIENVLDVFHNIATILENKDLKITGKKNQLKEYELTIRYFLSFQSSTDYIEYDYEINSDKIMTISKIKEKEL